ncbi:MAG: ABC transporter substrate-binding protein [Thermomicrobiales bacterium]|nr:ABC transporter substrate-binding protein [Thermomicrobiales bacterium]
MNRFDRRQVLKAAASVSALALAGRVSFASAQTPEASAATGDWPRVISAANGDIELATRPERIVVLEYELAENAYILGLDVVGLAERDSVNQYVPLPVPFSEDVVDVGTRDEVDLEAVIALQPDLILAAQPRQDAIVDQLSAIAPTVQLQTYSPFATPEGMTPIEHFQYVLTQVAAATGTEAEAEAAIDAFEALLADGAAAMAASEYAGAPFIWLGNITPEGVSIFNDHARIGFTIAQLGLENQGAENTETPGLHYTEVSLEQVGSFPAETIVFTSHAAQLAEERAEIYASDLWQGMPWIDNFKDLGEPNVWGAGSAVTLSELIQRVTGALGVTVG